MTTLAIGVYGLVFVIGLHGIMKAAEDIEIPVVQLEVHETDAIFYSMACNLLIVVSFIHWQFDSMFPMPGIEFELASDKHYDSRQGLLGP